uniref:RNA-directed DNA polymerase, eukaryota, reverse transcriptase zinc-binding domain protein n=1 Tax=Strongyloides venezuelensis TaxID=75913 RepID=A0A0K0FG63_STRVS
MPLMREDYVKFFENPEETHPILRELLPTKCALQKSCLFISFYDFQSFIFNQLKDDLRSLLPQIIIASLGEAQVVEPESHLYIDVRGGIIHNNVLYDLKFSHNPKNGLVASVGKIFDEWINITAPNFFNISIRSFDDLELCLNTFNESINAIQMLLPKTKNECPKIYIVDFVKENVGDDRRYTFKRLILVDIPCCRNSQRGLEVLSWLQSEHISNAKNCKDKIKYDPLYCAMEGFLAKNMSTMISLSSDDEKLINEFGKVKKKFSKMKVCYMVDDSISVRKYNESWYNALYKIKTICFLGKDLTYVSAVTGKEGKKKRKVSLIKKIENTLNDIIEKFEDSELQHDLGLKNHRLFESLIGLSVDKSLLSLIYDVKHHLMCIDKRLLSHIKDDEFYKLFATDEESDADSSTEFSTIIDNDSDDSIYEVMYEEFEDDNDEELYDYQDDDWDMNIEHLIQSFIEDTNFGSTESLSDIIERTCPNIREEYAFISEVMKDGKKEFDGDKFETLINEK